MLPIITVASDPFSLGEEVADAVAGELGWPLLSDEVFAAAAETVGEPADRIREAISEPPHFLGMSANTRKRLLAALGAAITGAVRAGGIVYRGPAGHHFIHGISHVIRTKVTATIGDRAARRAEVEGTTAERAEKQILAEDRKRFRTCREVFGEDCGDPVLYDLLVSTSDVTVKEAASLLVRAARRKRYQPQTWSIQCMANLDLTWQVRACLSRLDPDALVSVEAGRVGLRTRAAASPEDRLCRQMKEAVLALPGVTAVEVKTSEDLFRGRGQLLR